MVCFTTKCDRNREVNVKSNYTTFSCCKYNSRMIKLVKLNYKLEEFALINNNINSKGYKATATIENFKTSKLFIFKVVC